MRQNWYDDLVQSLQEWLDGFMASMRELAQILERWVPLFPRIREKQHDLRQQQLQMVDQMRGDYKHRPGGKRGVPARFRYVDEDVHRRCFNHQAAHPRLTREKSDLRRGRKNNHE